MAGSAADTYAVHLHHLDSGHPPIRNEIVTRLDLSVFDLAIRNDVSSGTGVSLAEQIDEKHYAAMPPAASVVALTILWHSFALNPALQEPTPRSGVTQCSGPAST